MHKVVSMADLYPVMEEAMLAGCRVTLTVTGASMLPLLRHRQDTVTLETVTGRLRPNDVVLYRQADGRFVLHRIVGMEKNGDCILCGDNQLVWDHHVKRRQIIGRLVAFTRKGRKIACTSPWYLAYMLMLPSLRLVRNGCFIARRYIGALGRFMIRHTRGNR